MDASCFRQNRGEEELAYGLESSWQYYALVDEIQAMEEVARLDFVAKKGFEES